MVRLPHCDSASWSRERGRSNRSLAFVGAPRPHAPRQGAQALHRSWELVCRASFGNSECAKIAKNLSPFLAADFSLFCHGSARGGPHVPRTPLRWAGALRSATWSGSFVRMDGRSQRKCLGGYLCTSNSTLSIPIGTDRHALKWQLELAAADTLQSAPSESTPQALHKPRKRRTPPTTLVAVRRHTLQLIRPEIHSAASGAVIVR